MLTYTLNKHLFLLFSIIILYSDVTIERDHIKEF